VSKGCRNDRAVLGEGRGTNCVVAVGPVAAAAETSASFLLVVDMTLVLEREYKNRYWISECLQELFLAMA